MNPLPLLPKRGQPALGEGRIERRRVAFVRDVAIGVLLTVSLAGVRAGDVPALNSDLTPPSVTMSLVRVLGALAIVFAVFLGGLWLYRNWQRLVTPKGQTPKLNVVEVKPLGHRHALYVVGYERQRMLLAASPTGVTMLTALPSEDREVRNNGVVVPQTQFADALNEALQRKP